MKNTEEKQVATVSGGQTLEDRFVEGETCMGIMRDSGMIGKGRESGRERGGKHRDRVRRKRGSWRKEGRERGGENERERRGERKGERGKAVRGETVIKREEGGRKEK